MSLWKRYTFCTVTARSPAQNDPQNLREEVAMDVDEEEDGTQRPRRVQDFGIEVDFDSLDEDEREVHSSIDNPFSRSVQLMPCLCPRMVLRKQPLSLTQTLLNSMPTSSEWLRT
jgi:hypothetical protein